MIVICTKEIYIYEVGKSYNAVYLYDKCLIADNDYIEFEWKIDCGEHNHYQFTNDEFKEYFIDISENRDKKILDILN